MSDIASTYAEAKPRPAVSKAKQPYRIEETHWGYIVTATGGLGAGIRLAQAISTVLGAIFLAIVVSLWLWPALTIGVDALFMRYFATVFFGALAVLFLWYASRGSRSEVQIDLSRGEVRDVIRNKAGKMTLLGSYGFDTVDEVGFEPNEAGDEFELVLHYGNTGGCIVVASGASADLKRLHARITKDVVINASKPAGGAPSDRAAAA